MPPITLSLYGKHGHVASDSHVLKQAKRTIYSTSESLHRKIMFRARKDGPCRKTDSNRSAERTKLLNKFKLHLLPLTPCLFSFCFALPLFCYLIFNSFCCLTFSPLPPPFFLSVSLSLSLWADRQRQRDCCCACSLTLSAHKSLSTVCMSPLLLHSSLPSLEEEWRNPVTCQGSWLAQECRRQHTR